MFAKKVKPEIIRPNHRARLRANAMRTDDRVICARGGMGILCCSGEVELHEIGARTHLYVDSKFTFFPFRLLQNNFAKWFRPKT